MARPKSSAEISWLGSRKPSSHITAQTASSPAPPNSQAPGTSAPSYRETASAAQDEAAPVPRRVWPRYTTFSSVARNFQSRA